MLNFIIAMALLILSIHAFFSKSKRQQRREYLGIQEEPLIAFKWGNVPVYLGLIMGGFVLHVIWKMIFG